MNYGNMMGMPGAPQGQPLSQGFERLWANFNTQVLQKLETQALECLYIVPAQLVIPPGGIDREIDIKADAHFECHFVMGDFTTLSAAGVDNGVNQCSVRITDGSNDLKLMDNFVPVNLFLSPGRTLAEGVAGNPTNQLFYPIPFPHIFAASGKIQIETQNSAVGVDNIVNLLFWGKKLRARLQSH
jgi:hypothetical protein